MVLFILHSLEKDIITFMHIYYSKHRETYQEFYLVKVPIVLGIQYCLFNNSEPIYAKVEMPIK